MLRAARQQGWDFRRRSGSLTTTSKQPPMLQLQRIETRLYKEPRSVPSKGSRVTSENGLVHGKWVRQLDVGALKPRKEKYFGPGNRSVQG